MEKKADGRTMMDVPRISEGGRKWEGWWEIIKTLLFDLPIHNAVYYYVIERWTLGQRQSLNNYYL